MIELNHFIEEKVAHSEERLTFEEFNKLLAPEDIEGLTGVEIEGLYQASSIFADFAYKDWVDSKHNRRDIIKS